MLKNKAIKFLKEELKDWEDFKFDIIEDNETSICIHIKNDIWLINCEKWFKLDNGNLAMYLKGEYYQDIETDNNNKFFWIELLTD